MAPSTACSASLLQGAWRPAYSGCSVEETAGDADVIPGRLLPVGVAQQGCGMVRDDDRDAPEPMHLVSQRPDRLLRVEEGLRRSAAHGQHDFRLEEHDLAEQVWRAGRDLVVLRQTVLRWAALHHVADEDPLAWQLDRGEDLREQLASRSHEGASGLVLHSSGTFPDDDEPRVLRPLARHGVASPVAQPALRAPAHLRGDGVERLGLLQGIAREQVAARGVEGDAGRWKRRARTVDLSVRLTTCPPDGRR